MCDDHLLVDIWENLQPELVECGLGRRVLPMNAVNLSEARPHLVIGRLDEQIQFCSDNTGLHPDQADLADTPALWVRGFEVDGSEVHI
jgi:hypothetical protein